MQPSSVRCFCWVATQPTGYNGTAGGPDCNESTWTTHEDWPSAVDEYLAMLQYEADMEAGAAQADSSADAVVETYNEETGEYTYEVPPNVGENATSIGESGATSGIERNPETLLGQISFVIWAFHEPPMNTYKSIGLSFKGMWQSLVGDPEVTKTFQHAFELQPLIGGQRQGQHIGAFVDGFIPFGDPLEGTYDGDNRAIRVTRLLGAATREIVLLYAGGSLASPIVGTARYASATWYQGIWISWAWPSALVSEAVPALSGLYSISSLINTGIKIGSIIDTIQEVGELIDSFQQD